MEEIVYERPKAIHDQRKGLMIASIILFTIALAFFAGTVFYIFDSMLTGDKNTNALGFVLFLVTTGWITYLPSLLLSIACICTSRFGLKSTSKPIRITCLVFLILSSVLLFALILIGILVALFPSILI